jgi:hypothetical protein
MAGDDLDQFTTAVRDMRRQPELAHDHDRVALGIER